MILECLSPFSLAVFSLDLPQVDLINFRVEYVRPRSGLCFLTELNKQDEELFRKSIFSFAPDLSFEYGPSFAFTKGNTTDIYLVPIARVLSANGKRTPDAVDKIKSRTR